LSTSNSRTPTDVHNFALDRSRSDFDNRHVIMISMVYELPFGRGKRWGSNLSPILNHLLGGWGMKGIFNYQSGEPYTLYAGNFTTNNTHTSAVLVVGPLDQGQLQFVPTATGPVMYNVGPLITNASDPHYNCRNLNGTQTFFCIPPPGQTGSGRNLVEGPNFWNLDAALSKNIKMTERFSLQLRAEFFNVLNHANYENPRNASVGSPAIATSSRSQDNFGLTCCFTAASANSTNVNPLGEPMRVMQFGAKLNFYAQR